MIENDPVSPKNLRKIVIFVRKWRFVSPILFKNDGNESDSKWTVEGDESGRSAQDRIEKQRNC